MSMQLLYKLINRIKIYSESGLSIQTSRVHQGNSLLGDFANIIAKWMGYPFIQWNMNLLGEVLKNRGVFVTEYVWIKQDICRKESKMILLRDWTVESTVLALQHWSFSPLPFKQTHRWAQRITIIKLEYHFKLSGGKWSFFPPQD